MSQALNMLDTGFVAVFALEALVKVLVLGLAFNGPSSYLRNGWNVMDAVVVVLGG